MSNSRWCFTPTFDFMSLLLMKIVAFVYLCSTIYVSVNIKEKIFQFVKFVFDPTIVMFLFN